MSVQELDFPKSSKLTHRLMSCESECVLEGMQKYAIGQITTIEQYFQVFEKVISDKTNSRESKKRIFYALCQTFSILYFRRRPPQSSINLYSWIQTLLLNPRADGFVFEALYKIIMFSKEFEVQEDPLIMLYKCSSANRVAFDQWIQERYTLCLNEYASVFITKHNSEKLSWSTIIDSFNHTKRLLDLLHLKNKITLEDVCYDKSFLASAKIEMKQVINVRTSGIRVSTKHHKPLDLMYVKQIFDRSFKMIKETNSKFFAIRRWIILLFGFVSAFRIIDIRSCKTNGLPDDIIQYKTVFKGGIEKDCNLAFLFLHMPTLNPEIGVNWYRQWIRIYMELRNQHLGEHAKDCACLFVCNKQKQDEKKFCNGSSCFGMSISHIRDIVADALKITSETHCMKSTSVNWIRKLSSDPKVWSFHAHHNNINTTLNYYADVLYDEKKENIERYFKGLLHYYKS